MPASQNTGGQLLLQVRVLGFLLSLIGRYEPGKGFLLVLDGEEPAQQQAKKAQAQALEKPSTAKVLSASQQEASNFVKERLTEDKSLFQTLKSQLGQHTKTAL